MGIAQRCYDVYWTNPGSNIPQNSSCTAAYLPSLKPSNWTRHVGSYWRSKNEFIINVLQWTLSQYRANLGRPSRTDTVCSLKDLPKAMDDWDEWRERFREIRTSHTTWYIYIYMCVCVCVCVGNLSREWPEGSLFNIYYT